MVRRFLSFIAIIFLINLVLVLGDLAFASADLDCKPTKTTLHRGQERKLLLCDESIGGRFIANVESGVDILYQQPLTQCSPDDKRPGIYLRLTAMSDATSTTLTSENSCAQLNIEVPEQIHGDATLIELENTSDLQLTIATPHTLDSQQLCKRQLEFTDPLGPQFELVGQPQCDGQSYRRSVRPRDQRRSASTVVLSSSAGNGPDIVAQVTLPPPAWKNSMTENKAKFVDVNGVRTRYFDQGTGQTILFVHGGQAGGYLNSAQKWEQNFHELSENYRVIALDRLGQGQTQGLAAPQDYERYFELDVEHLGDFIAALRLENLILIGHSQGGWPITRFAVDNPDKVACLVNIDSVLIPDDPKFIVPSLKFLLYLSGPAIPEQGPTIPSLQRGMAMRWPTLNNITDVKARRALDYYQSEQREDIYQAMLKFGMTPAAKYFRNLKAELMSQIATHGLDMPSLIVWGELDPQVSLAGGEAMQNIFALQTEIAGFEVMQGAGHAPFIDYPERFNQLVIDFCDAKR